ncbi:D-amino acid oxidase [Rubrobacter xylanophilus DSM 9941]|uniref:D-amino-acid oxidase n=2 Tax=Rubrobacter xylanophilus TaxID=49319 RepID=DAO_RUBXD|nr:D-amino acid oxidase [Rubrobacter xylanophilus DSM 9941]
MCGMRGRVVARAVVVGCGVAGLSAAIALRERGFGVRVVAREPPERTTSAVAAAVWYPYRAYPEERVLSWGARTFEVFRGLAADPRTGVRLGEGVELLRRSAPGEPWWREAVSGFRRCREEELPPGCRGGYRFVAPVAEMPAYLAYLLDRLRGAGGTLELREVSSLEEAGEGADVVVNCSGVWARELARDPSVFPIRGQILRVANPGLERFVLDEENPAGLTYIVPRSGDCVLGGTAEEGRWSTEPDPATAEAILRRCSALEPRLRGARVLEHRAGLRPGRPEVRLELEELPGGTPCVHNYGHGGSGVTLSWGCAEEAAALAGAALS